MKTCTTCCVDKPLSDFGVHPKGKYGVRSICEPCRSIKAGVYYRKNRERINARTKDYRMRNPDIRRETMKMSNNNNREYRKNWNLIKNYGISLDDFNALFERQNKQCAICKTAEARWCVDHDHTTGAVRSILCPQCNLGLGSFRDSAHLLSQAATYLEFHKTTCSSVM